jgi:hypothetical protein
MVGHTGFLTTGRRLLSFEEGTQPDGSTEAAADPGT